MIFKFLFQIIILSLPHVAFGGKLGGDQQAKAGLNITADSLSVDNRDGGAAFKGGVTVVFDDIILKTELLKIYYAKTSSRKTVTRIEAPGKIKAIKKLDNEVLIADSGNYDAAAGSLTLTGNVMMQRGKNILITNKMVYFTKFRLITDSKNEK